jgi:hypothetical protein
MKKIGGHKMKKSLLILLCLIFTFSLVACSSSKPVTETATDEITDIEVIEETDEITDIEVIEEAEDIQLETDTLDILTTGQQNALERAKDHVDSGAYSYSYIIHLLELEGFSSEDAIYAADNCGADWFAEAVESATYYINNTSYTLEAIVSVMMYEGFTEEQANYGADVASGGDC